MTTDRFEARAPISRAIAHLLHSLAYRIDPTDPVEVQVEAHRRIAKEQSEALKQQLTHRTEHPRY